jgi:hypothetical protein
MIKHVLEIEVALLVPEPLECLGVVEQIIPRGQLDFGGVPGSG